MKKADESREMPTSLRGMTPGKKQDIYRKGEMVFFATQWTDRVLTSVRDSVCFATLWTDRVLASVRDSVCFATLWTD